MMAEAGTLVGDFGLGCRFAVLLNRTKWSDQTRLGLSFEPPRQAGALKEAPPELWPLLPHR
jgi:hypothetical protein